MEERDEVLETVRAGLTYIPLKDLLIKPLDPIKVSKEITEQIPTGEKDEDGFEKYDTKTEVKEVESEWAVGIIVDMPATMEDQFDLHPGYKVIYNKKMAKDFDLFKDSQLVKPYDVVAICK